MPSSISYYGIPPFSCNRVSVVNADIAHICSDEPQDGYYYYSSGADSGFFAQSASDIQASNYVATGSSTNTTATHTAPSPSYSHSPGFLTSPAPAPGFITAPGILNVPAAAAAHSTLFAHTPKSPQTQTQTKSTRTRRRTDPTHIPRPRNAFIIFRSEFIRAQKVQAVDITGVSAFGGPNTNTNTNTNHQNELSKQAGLLWRSMSPPSKEKYQDMAKTEQDMHRRVYPDYQYRSNRVLGGKQRTRKPKFLRVSVEGGSEASSSPESAGCFTTPSPASTESFATPSPSQAAATPEIAPSIPYTHTFAHLPSEAERYTYTTQTTRADATTTPANANANDGEYLSHLLPPSLQFEDVFAGNGNALGAMFPELRQTFSYDLQQTFDVNINAEYSFMQMFNVDDYNSMQTSEPTPTLALECAQVNATLDCAHLDFNFFPEPEFTFNELDYDLEYLASMFPTYS